MPERVQSHAGTEGSRGGGDAATRSTREEDCASAYAKAAEVVANLKAAKRIAEHIGETLI